MATFAVSKILEARFADPNHIDVKHHPEADSQTFVEGDLVYLNANRVTICGADPAEILGVAMRDGANDTNNRNIPVQRITPAGYFTMNVKSGASDHVLVDANIMTAYGIRRDAAGQWVVDVSDTTNKRVRIVEPDEGAVIGDTNARCIVQFDSDFIQGYQVPA